jgi:hypothetical protein
MERGVFDVRAISSAVPPLRMRSLMVALLRAYAADMADGAIFALGL